MVTKKRRTTDSVAKARKRFVDQPNQWIDTTPSAVKREHERAWKELEESLTPTQRKKMGIKKK